MAAKQILGNTQPQNEGYGEKTFNFHEWVKQYLLGEIEQLLIDKEMANFSILSDKNIYRNPKFLEIIQSKPFEINRLLNFKFMEAITALQVINNSDNNNIVYIGDKEKEIMKSIKEKEESIQNLNEETVDLQTKYDKNSKKLDKILQIEVENGKTNIQQLFDEIIEQINYQKSIWINKLDEIIIDRKNEDKTMRNNINKYNEISINLKNYLNQQYKQCTNAINKSMENTQNTNDPLFEDNERSNEIIKISDNVKNNYEEKKQLLDQKIAEMKSFTNCKPKKLDFNFQFVIDNNLKEKLFDEYMNDVSSVIMTKNIPKPIINVLVYQQYDTLQTNISSTNKDYNIYQFELFHRESDDNKNKKTAHLIISGCIREAEILMNNSSYIIYKLCLAYYGYYIQKTRIIPTFHIDSDDSMSKTVFLSDFDPIDEPHIAYLKCKYEYKRCKPLLNSIKSNEYILYPDFYQYGKDGILIIQENKTVILEGTSKYEYTIVLIKKNGKLTVKSWNQTTKSGGKLYIKSLNGVYLKENAQIILNGKGYKGGKAGNQGESYKGIGIQSKRNNFGGGGSPCGGGAYGTDGKHGGDGYFDAYGGKEYGKDDWIYKLYLGSGGGGGNTQNDLNQWFGGNGGGAMKLETTILKMGKNTMITANGGSSCGQCGAGSGGSIYIECQVISMDKTAKISCNGGKSVKQQHQYGYGGAGRLRIDTNRGDKLYKKNNEFDAEITFI